MSNLDQKDLIILQELEKADRKREPTPSLEELKKALPGINSTTTVWNRMQRLQERELVNLPARKMARSYRISDKGKQALADEGLLPWPF